MTSGPGKGPEAPSDPESTTSAPALQLKAAIMPATSTRRGHAASTRYG